jgi:hypothetical protein
MFLMGFLGWHFRALTRRIEQTMSAYRTITAQMLRGPFTVSDEIKSPIKAYHLSPETIVTCLSNWTLGTFAPFP